jgi:beta-galactosidase GanA
MGLNTVSTYVFWNLYEPKPGVYDFRGNLDAAALIRTAQEEGLYVILRPGPWVCAEWDLGGLPSWLFADPNMALRSGDETFLGPTRRWLQRLGREVAPLESTRGGPIIAVHGENEYRSFGNDKDYMKSILAALRSAGLGEALLYTADGGNELQAGTLPEIHAVVNFGPGEAKEEFAKLRKFRPGSPLLCGESFTDELRSERQGSNGAVTLVGQKLSGWQAFPLPMDDLTKIRFSKKNGDGTQGPGFCRGQFVLREVGDTFLDTRGWGKGAAWINGHALGRFWNLGPQQTLYGPASWLLKRDQRCRCLCLYRGPAKESAHSRIASAGVG